jgi:hypothetical protein
VFKQLNTLIGFAAVMSVVSLLITDDGQAGVSRIAEPWCAVLV